MKSIVFNCLVFVFYLTHFSHEIEAQATYQSGDVKYMQKVLWLLGQQGFPYAVSLTVDSLQLDSVSANRSFFHNCRTIYGCDYALKKQSSDTTWLKLDCNGILYSGRYQYRTAFVSKDSWAWKENLRYWQFHKQKGETIVVDRIIDSLKLKQEYWAIDSIVNRDFFGINRDVYYLSGYQQQRSRYIDGIGFTEDKTGLYAEVDDELLLQVCGVSLPKYFEAGYFNPLPKADCNFDTIAAQFVRFHSASVSTLNPAAISVFPNPAADVLHVEAEASNQPYLYQIINSNGKIILEISATDSISLAGLPNGIYILQRQSEKGFAHCKFVLLR